MKREEYLKELKLTLEQSDFGPVEEAISYFSEMLDDRIAEEGMDEEAAVATMEAPGQVASQLAQTRQKEAQQQAKSEDEIEPGVRTINAKPSLVHHILVRDRNMRLILRGWDKDEIVIHHPETKRVRYDFKLEDGRLSLLRTPLEFSINIFLFESLNHEMSEVTLDVPQELAAELDLRTSNGRLTAENINCWGSAALGTGNGALSLKNFSAKNIQLKTSNGSITLEKVQAKKELSAVTSNGKITAEQAAAPELLTLKTSNGSISVSKVESRSLQLTSSNGSIKGDVPGSLNDYSIRSGTSNGKNNLPTHQEGGSKTLSVHTSNARIDLSFSGS